MLTSSSNLPQKSLKIKLEFDDENENNNNNELFCKHNLTTTQPFMARSLEENYQGGSSVAVPFIWESRPGTPKIKFRENPLPPLTPPPSYFYTSAKTPTRKHSIPNPFSNIFSKRTARRRTSFPVSPASSSSSSSYSSQFSSPATVLRSRERHEMSNTRKSFESRMVDEDDCESPVSTLCFGIGRRGNAARSRWGYASVIKVLLREV